MTLIETEIALGRIDEAASVLREWEETLPGSKPLPEFRFSRPRAH